MSHLATRIGPADHGRALTLAEFCDVDKEPGSRYELARGLLEVTEVPHDPHCRIEQNLLRRLGDFGRDHPGRIDRCEGGGALPLRLPGMVSYRNPDVTVVLRHAPKDHRGRRVPDLAFEVVSSGGEARDYEHKREEYLRYGLREYWIVDPRARRVTVLIRDGDVWIERVSGRDQIAQAIVLPGFAVPVSRLWTGTVLDDCNPNAAEVDHGP
jgi:Uma2 family endonuclease